MANDSAQIAKEAAGKAAAELIERDMLVGIGTGSTAAFFIKHLAVRCRQGLKIIAVATSQRSYDLARSEGISLVDINTVTTLDIAVDGADEIDAQKRMIKGGGGALLREKIIASMSGEMVVVIDAQKRVDYLGKFPLPVEIVPFAFKATQYHFEQLGFKGSIRTTGNGQQYVTDNQNLIFDVHLEYPCQNPEVIDAQIRSIPGVVETGFFFKLAGRVITGFPDGRVEIRS